MPMLERLEPLRLYALRRNSLVDRELAAYEAAFDALRSFLVDTVSAAFVQTAAGDALAMHEKLVGLQPRPGLSDEVRRSLVIYRRGIAPFDFSLAGMVNSIRAAGMEAEIICDPAGEKLTIRSLNLIDDFLDLDSVKQSLYTMLPAHLEAAFDIGFMSWDMFEQADVTWDAWDAKDFTWEQFDLAADKIFE